MSENKPVIPSDYYWVVDDATGLGVLHMRGRPISGFEFRELGLTAEHPRIRVGEKVTFEDAKKTARDALLKTYHGEGGSG